MRLSSLGTGILALTSLLASGSALAVPFSATSVSTISPCPSYCGGSGGKSNYDINTNPGETFSSSSLDVVDGLGNAQTMFVGESLLPELKAEAFSNSGSRSSKVASAATGMQQFVYSGPTSTITLDAVVDAVIVESGSTGGDAYATGSIVVVLAEDGVDVPVSTHYPTFVFEIIPLTTGLASLGEEFVRLDATGSTALSVGFTVEDGNSIYVWSQLRAYGIRGGSADAFDTMSLSFSDPTGLAPVLGAIGAAPVPEPSTLALLGLGWLGALGVRRRMTAA